MVCLKYNKNKFLLMDKAFEGRDSEDKENFSEQAGENPKEVFFSVVEAGVKELVEKGDITEGYAKGFLERAVYA